MMPSYGGILIFPCNDIVMLVYCLYREWSGSINELYCVLCNVLQMFRMACKMAGICGKWTVVIYAAHSDDVVVLEMC